MFNIALSPFITGFLISLIFTPPTIYLAKKFKLMDDPKVHKHPAIIHKKSIPRLGGLPIFAAILIGLLLLIPLNKTFIAFLFACFTVVITGILDDKYDLSPYLRFIFNIISAVIVVESNVSIPFVTNPFGGILHFDINFLGGVFAQNIFPKAIAVIWIVWIMNMLNWSKGVDGQMPGIAVITAVIVGIASLRFPVLEPLNISVAKIAFLVAGSALGFLVFNFHPAKIFPGYSAAVLGFAVGVLSIMAGVKLATAVLVMGVPITDGIFTITRRLLNKKSPFWHDKEHLHHLLLNLGFSQRSIAIFYWAVSLFLGILSLSLSSKGKMFAIISVFILVVGFIFALRFLNKKDNIYDE